MLSIFDIFKIGVGPSSSHTNGPMIAGYEFANLIDVNATNVSRIVVDLYGSLSLTGIGHHTDQATILGLLGNKPDTINIASAKATMKKMLAEGILYINSRYKINFNYKTDIIFHKESLPLHENGMTITALDKHNFQIVSETYYSIGGGFIVTADELRNNSQCAPVEVKFPFTNANEMLAQTDKHGLSLGRMVLQNELAYRDADAIDAQADKIWQVMSSCMERGFKTEGILEGGLNLTRRAPGLLKVLNANATTTNDPMDVMDWVDLFAFAVSEENAAGGQVVTSPTNGAAGVIPAVLMYYHRFIRELDTRQLKEFFAVAGAIGILYKTNASISGAEVG